MTRFSETPNRLPWRSTRPWRLAGAYKHFGSRKSRWISRRAAEVLAERVVELQTIQLDAVTGATYSSKAILKAGEKALRRNIRP
jgi:major membrane immunogen (membrane-anchored lipoprotein)